MSEFLISSLPDILRVKGTVLLEGENPELETDDGQKMVRVSLEDIFKGWEGGKTIVGGDDEEDKLNLRGPLSISFEDPIEIPSDSEPFRIFSEGNNLWVASNATLTDGSWQKDVVSEPSWGIKIGKSGVFLVYSEASQDPMSWSTVLDIGPDSTKSKGEELGVGETILIRLMNSLLDGGTNLHSGILYNLHADEGGVDSEDENSWFLGIVDGKLVIRNAPSGGSTVLSSLVEVEEGALNVILSSLRLGPIHHAYAPPSSGSAVYVLDRSDETDSATFLIRDGGVEKWEIGSSPEIEGSPGSFYVKRVSGGGGTREQLFKIDYGTKEIEVGEEGRAKVLPNGCVELANLDSDPSTGGNGSMYYNTTSHKVRVKVNGSWQDM